MRTITLLLALLVMTSAAYATVETATMDVYAEYSFIGPPLVPINPNPASIFGAAGVDIEWSGIITRLDAPTGNYIDYQAWNPDQQWNMLLGEGYWVNMTSGTVPSNPTTVSYEGLPDGVPDAYNTQTDMWISLPGYQLDTDDAGGFHFISTPFNHAIPFNVAYYGYDGANIKVTDGSTVRTLAAAASGSDGLPSWIVEPFTYYDGPTGNWYNAGFLSGVYEDDEMRPGVMYLVQTKKDNLALIIPALRPY